jgi:hypothetical protein
MAPSFDYLVGAEQERLGHREADRLGGLEIDDQLVFRRLFDGQVGRFGTLEDFVDVNSGASSEVVEVGATRMNEELYAATGRDEGRREAANVRACRLAGAISRLSATYQQGLLTLRRKRTGGNQHVTVKHIHQQVNVTEGGQAVVAGDTVTRGQGERRRGIIEK